MSILDGYEVHQEISSVMKIYPNFIRIYDYKNAYVIRRHDYDPRNPNRTTKSSKVTFDQEDYEKASLRRAKTNLIDLTLCNGFELFATFTFAKDRYDIDAKKRQMAFWLNNQRILHGKFAYIIVPELHKDGALHFHALFSGFNGKLKDSGKLIHGRKAFNFTGYKAGFNSAVKIDNLEKVSSYVSKYMTKDMPTFRNKQRYWCSNGLIRPVKIANPLLTEQDKELFTNVFENSQKVILEYRGELSEADIKRIKGSQRDIEDQLWVSEW